MIEIICINLALGFGMLEIEWRLLNDWNHNVSFLKYIVYFLEFSKLPLHSCIGLFGAIGVAWSFCCS